MSSAPFSPKVSQLLHQIPLLVDMTDAHIEALAGETRLERTASGQTIFYQGDPCERVYIVAAGRVKIVFHDRDGREVILEMIAQGEVFGGSVLFFPRHPATAIAMEDSTIASFSTDAYARYLLQSPQALLKMLRMLGERHLAMINMQTMAGERVERRMAHILLKLATRVGRPTDDGMLITISLSRQDLADMACTTLETSIRTLSRFQKEGLVSTQRGGYILVRNVNALKDLTD